MLATPAATAQRVTAWASADSVTVGERFRMLLIVEHNLMNNQPLFPDDVRPDSLDADDLLPIGDIEVIERLSSGTRYGTGGLRTDSVLYEVTTFAVDTAYVPPVPVRFLTAEGDTMAVFSFPLEIPVTSLMSADEQDIRGLAPLAEFPLSPWPWVVGGLYALLVLLGLVTYWRRRPQFAEEPEEPEPLPPTPVLPAYDEAMGRLEQLEEANLRDPDTTKLFYIGLSDTLRHYLGRRLGLQAMEETTPELLRDLHSASIGRRLPTTVEEGTKAVLELADLVKFADAYPAPEQGEWARQETAELIRSVETTVPPVPVEEEPPIEAPEPIRVNATDGPEDAPEARTPWYQNRQHIAGLVLGVGLGMYVGVETILVPGLVGLVTYLLAYRFLARIKRPLFDALAVQVALFVWLGIGVFTTSADVAAQLLIGGEALLGLGLVAWWIMQPSRTSALPLLALHALGLYLGLDALLDLTWATPAHQATTLDTALYLLSVVFVLLGLRTYERNHADG